MEPKLNGHRLRDRTSEFIMINVFAFLFLLKPSGPMTHEAVPLVPKKNPSSMAKIPFWILIKSRSLKALCSYIPAVCFFIK